MTILHLPESTSAQRQLRHAVAQWVELDAAQWNTLAALFAQREIAAGQHIITPGDYRHELVFVSSGLLRFYYLAEDGKESNKAFVAEDDFAGPLAAFSLDLPVVYGVQALEPTLLLAARYTDFVALYDQHPMFDRLGRKLAEWLLTRKELRTRSLLQQQATERYLDFVRQHPRLAERVPQYHIASYLGITDVSLSRIRRGL